MTNWINVDTELPELDLTVWCCDGKRIWIGGRGDGGEGWVWGRCYDSPYLNKGGILEAEIDCDDDYQPTHWMMLPTLPEQF
jgi:hypothetical protein